MHKKVAITRPGQTDPTIVDCLSADVMVANRLCNNKVTYTDLVIVTAYMSEHENPPTSLAEVEKWARKERIWAEQIGDTPDPTQSGPLSD